MLNMAIRGEGFEQQTAFNMVKRHLSKLPLDEVTGVIQESCKHIECITQDVSILKQIVKGIDIEAIVEKGKNSFSPLDVTDIRDVSDEMYAHWEEHFADMQVDPEIVEEFLELKQRFFDDDTPVDLFDSVSGELIKDLIIPRPILPRNMKRLIKKWLSKYFPGHNDYRITSTSIDAELSMTNPYHFYLAFDELFFSEVDEYYSDVYQFFESYVNSKGYVSEYKSSYELSFEPYYPHPIEHRRRSEKYVARHLARRCGISVSDINLTMQEFMDKYEIRPRRDGLRSIN